MLVQYVRKKMIKFHNKHNKVNNWAISMPHFFHKKLARNLNSGRKCLICPSTKNLSEVDDEGRQFVVDLAT